jgi:hypothetical protein
VERCVSMDAGEEEEREEREEEEKVLWVGGTRE